MPRFHGIGDGTTVGGASQHPLKSKKGFSRRSLIAGLAGGDLVFDRQ